MKDFWDGQFPPDNLFAMSEVFVSMYHFWESNDSQHVQVQEAYISIYYNELL